MRSCQPIMDGADRRGVSSFLSGASASGSEDEHRLDALVEVIVNDNVGSGGGGSHFGHFDENLKILKRLWPRLSFSRPLSS